jgi:hypothetical protein
MLIAKPFDRVAGFPFRLARLVRLVPTLHPGAVVEQNIAQ